MRFLPCLAPSLMLPLTNHSNLLMRVKIREERGERREERRYSVADIMCSIPILTTRALFQTGTTHSSFFLLLLLNIGNSLGRLC